MPNAHCDVVIATRNRPAALQRCLEGLRQQSYTDFGVIIVDDASDPPISNLLGEGAIVGLDVRLVTMEEQSGPAAARNAGVAASNAEYIVFIDDDVRPDWRMLATHMVAVSAGTEAAPIVACGPFVEPYDWQPTPWNYWEAQAARKEAENLTAGVFAPTWRQFHTGNNCLPRSTFVEAGGFNVDFKRAEDDELAYRLFLHGCQFVFCPQAIAWHYAERTLEAWLAIPRAYAHFDVLMDRIHPGSSVLDFKLRELNQRHLAIRRVRKLLRGPMMRSAGITASTRLGQGLFATGLRGSSVKALSLAYDLSYIDGLTVEIGERLDPRLRAIPLAE